jgi:hypothetical protein
LLHPAFDRGNAPSFVYLHASEFAATQVVPSIARIRTASGTQQRRLAGDAIRIIKLGAFTRPTFFVEDAAHTRFIETMAAALSKDVSVLECGNSSNVKSLYSLSQSDGGRQNCYLQAAT